MRIRSQITIREYLEEKSPKITTILSKNGRDNKESRDLTSFLAEDSAISCCCFGCGLLNLSRKFVFKMSSPSPGKRRMDTDVVKLYPLRWNVNMEYRLPAIGENLDRFVTKNVGRCSELAEVILCVQVFEKLHTRHSSIVQRCRFKDNLPNIISLHAIFAFCTLWLSLCKFCNGV